MGNHIKEIPLLSLPDIEKRLKELDLRYEANKANERKIFDLIQEAKGLIIKCK